MPPTTDLPARDTPIEQGATAPDFTLLDQDRNEWTLSDRLGAGDVALCFYPMDFSPVCTTEMQCVSDEIDAWRAKGVQVVGVSCDSFFTHAAWAETLNLRHPLLADMHRAVCRAYGFYWPDLNVASRGTVLITRGADGSPTVAWVQAREIKDAMVLEDLLAQVG